jgi:hypothetical protein
MKYATVEDAIASSPHPILPIVQGEPDYHTIHAIRKLLQANTRAINTHLGGGALIHLGLIVYDVALGHLCLIFSDAAYAIVTPTGANGPILWTNPTYPGRAQVILDQRTAAHLSVVIHSWEEDVITYRMFNTVQQALKKRIITVFEPMYLDILNGGMVGFANITAREISDHFFLTYGNITVIDLENSFEQMRKAWDPQQPVETLFKKIQNCVDLLEVGGVSIGHPQKINVGYAIFFCHS